MKGASREVRKGAIDEIVVKVVGEGEIERQ